MSLLQGGLGRQGSIVNLRVVSGAESRHALFSCVLHRSFVLSVSFLIIEEALQHLLVTNSVVSPLLLLRILYNTEVADAVHFVVNLCKALFCLLAAQDSLLRLVVFSLPFRFLLVKRHHVQVSPIQVVF